MATARKVATKYLRDSNGRFASKGSISKSVKREATPKKAKAPRIKPLSHYDSYAITRDITQVSFGCGAVKVNRQDLLTVAVTLENPQAQEALKALRRLHDAARGYRNMRDILDIPPATLRRIAG